MAPAKAEIVQEPGKAKFHREWISAAKIRPLPGSTSGTFPALRLTNASDSHSAFVVVSCVEANPPHRAHPNKVINVAEMADNGGKPLHPGGIVKTKFDW